MCVFVVLHLIFPYQAKRLLGEYLRNDLFYVEWHVKTLIQSVSLLWRIRLSLEIIVVKGHLNRNCVCFIFTPHMHVIIHLIMSLGTLHHGAT